MGYLLEGTCNDPCPRGYFKHYDDNDWKVCKNCHETCRTCSGELESQCNTC